MSKQSITRYITTKYLLFGGKKRYIATLIGGRPIVDKNGKTIIKNTRKEAQDFINKNWKNIRFYN